MTDNNESWLFLTKKAWIEFLNDITRLGERGGFLHSREEDMRSYIYCKFVALIKEEGRWLIDLRTEFKFEGKRLDLALGIGDGNKCLLGIELKPEIKGKSVKSDLNKLLYFLKKGYIETGVFIGIDRHLESWDIILDNWFRELGIIVDAEDRGDNNFWVIRSLTPLFNGTGIVHYDSVLIVLRLFD